MRERERFASQGAKRRGRNPQRCYDPSDDRNGTAGVPSTQPVLVREPTSAFSVRWGGSYCPLCSTPRNRGRSAPRKIRTKDSAYNGNLWRVPITAQSSTDATDHDALQPLRGSEADCVRSPIRQSIPSRPQHRSKRRAHRARRDGAEPHFR